MLDYVSLAALQVTALGTEAVILFFCVSGFSMAHSILHNNNPFVFYLRRAIRIWPPYLVAVCFAWGVCRIYLELEPAHLRSVGCANTFCSLKGLLQITLYLDVIIPLTRQFWSLP